MLGLWSNFVFQISHFKVNFKFHNWISNFRTKFLEASTKFHSLLTPRFRTFHGKKHRHSDSDLNTNQVICYAFRYVLSYFDNENELTELKRLISGRNQSPNEFSCRNSSTFWLQRWPTSYCWHGYNLITSHAKPLCKTLTFPNILSCKVHV